MEALLRVSESKVGSCGPRIIALMAVETCSKPLFAMDTRHGKSPCFSEVTFFQLVGPDYSLLILPCVDVGNFLECAF